MKKTGDYLGSPADLDGVVSVTPQPVGEAAGGPRGAGDRRGLWLLC
ncbi:hypothetical protein [uncultured Limosilactobacillus sp.]|nr:hypothetical protein [uncultured Limosilactobacillus sp.]